MKGFYCERKMLRHVEYGRSKTRKDKSSDWVKFEEGKGSEKQRAGLSQAEFGSQAEFFTSMDGIHGKKEANPRKQTGPNSRGILHLGEFDTGSQLISEDNVKLISSDVQEGKDKLDSIAYQKEESQVFIDYNEQMFAERRDILTKPALQAVQDLDFRVPPKKQEETPKSPKSEPTPFDIVPGFAKNNRSPRHKNLKMKNPRANDTERNPYVQMSNEMKKSKSFENDFSVVEDDSQLVTIAEFLESSCSLGDSRGASEDRISTPHLETAGTILSSSPRANHNWVSFENDVVTKENLHSNELRRKQYVDNTENTSQMSSSFASPRSNISAMLSTTQISDVYNIPDEINSNSKEPTTLLDFGSPDKNDAGQKDQEMILEFAAKEDLDTDSNFSAEIYDLNNLENDILIDRRKPFPKEGIFQASSTIAKQDVEKTPEMIKKQARQDSSEGNNMTPLDDFPMRSNRTEWSFLYRYPDKKKKFASRKWLNVKVTIKDDAICITGRFENADITKEIPLHPFFVFTMPALHDNDNRGKVHSVKLQYVKYKETRKMASKFQLEHSPSYTPVLKLAAKDHRSIKEFIEAVENVVRKIETHRDKGITHRHEEIFIDCDDVCQYELDGSGKVKQYNITCQVRLRAFITGIPNLYLFLNDIMSYNKQKNQRMNKKAPKSNRWIKLENIEYHPSVDVNMTNSEGGIVFKPPDACSFELIRFRVRGTKVLPMVFKASIDFTTSKSFQIKAECKIVGEGKMMKYRRNNIVVRFPIPTTWTSVFVKSRSFSGQKKYVRARADDKTFASGVGRTSRCFIEVSTGSAKYEPEYGSLVWRVGDLPILASGVPADAVQTFDCQVNLPFEIDMPKTKDLCAEVEYEIPHAVGSEIQVQEVLLSDGHTPDKWVCYRALYYYKVLMNVTNQQRLGYLT